jgi:hypothetical protein
MDLPIVKKVISAAEATQQRSSGTATHGEVYRYIYLKNI